MKNLTKKLFLSMLTVAFAVVALGTTTFAWFTLSTEAKVEAFDAKVTGGEGFEIQVTDIAGGNASDWYSGSLPASAVKATLDAKYGKNWQLDAVTPNDETIAAFSRKTLVGGSHTDAEASNEKGEFIEFKLNFRLVNKEVASQPTLLLIGGTLGETGATETSLDRSFKLSSTGASYTANHKITYHASDAARVAIFGSDNAVKGIYEKKAATPSVNTSANTAGFCGADWGAVKYYNLKNSIDGTDGAITPPPSDTYTAKAIEDLKFDAPLQCGALSAGGLTLIVKVWIEGWDAECINAIFNQVLKTSLTFKLRDAGQA